MRERIRIKPEHREWLLRARVLAMAIIEARGEVNVNDLRDKLPAPPVPQLWSAVFTDRRFIPTGESRRSNFNSGSNRTWTKFQAQS